MLMITYLLFELVWLFGMYLIPVFTFMFMYGSIILKMRNTHTTQVCSMIIIIYNITLLYNYAIVYR